MIPFCIGMPVRFKRTAPLWHVAGLHVETQGEYKGEFSGLLIIERDNNGLTEGFCASPDDLTPVDGLLWYEEVEGGKSILHIGLDDLIEEAFPDGPDPP